MLTSFFFFFLLAQVTVHFVNNEGPYSSLFLSLVYLRKLQKGLLQNFVSKCLVAAR